MVDLSQQELALARHNSYTLLGRVLREGVTEELLPYLREIPDLPVGEFDADESAVNHQTLFRFTLHPHESIFLDTTGLLGGELTEEAQGAYRDSGYGVNDGADHIGHELGFLGFLAGAEADAWEDKRPLIAKQMQAKQATFMQNHLLRWLPALTIALQQQDNALYAKLGEFVWMLVASHSEELKLTKVDDFLPPVPSLLAEDDTSLKKIANVLASPALSGWWLSQADLNEIGRSLDLPRGFGGRVQTMMNLFRSASQFDSGDALIQAFSNQAQKWQTEYENLDGLQPYVSIWQERLESTVTMLSDMETEIQTLELED